MAYNLLKGKRGIITGALDSNSIAWKVAEKAHEEGATFVLTNAPIAMRMGEINSLAEKTNSKIIPADATSVEELTNLFTQSQEILGGKIDFVLHSIGMSVNIRKKIAYPELTNKLSLKQAGAIKNKNYNKNYAKITLLKVPWHFPKQIYLVDHRQSSAQYVVLFH